MTTAYPNAARIARDASGRFFAKPSGLRYASASSFVLKQEKPHRQFNSQIVMQGIIP